MADLPEVVITGLGVVCPIGIGMPAVWASLMAGRSGIGPLKGFDAGGFAVRFGAELPGFDAKQYVRPRKSLKVMSREIQTAFAAGSMAVDDAHLDIPSLDPERLGVVFGSEMLYSDIPELTELYRSCRENGEFHFAQFGPQFPVHMYPLWMLKYLPNMAACHLGIAYDARGPNNSVVAGDTSSLLAVSEAAAYIHRGHADVVISGGAGSRLNLTQLVYRGDIDLSHREDDPPGASRPFDAARDGMVNGEGAAAVVLESRAHAAARGAPILARVLGSGSSFDTEQDGRPGRAAAIRRSIRTALAAACLEPEEIHHVNAHGLSTVDEDAAEAQAIRQTLGDVKVTAPKSFFGNLGAGGGAVELVISVLALGHGLVPPTRNYTQPDPDCPIHVVAGTPQAARGRAALLLNQSGTGGAAALVIGSA